MVARVKTGRKYRGLVHFLEEPTLHCSTGVRSEFVAIDPPPPPKLRAELVAVQSYGSLPSVVVLQTSGIVFYILSLVAEIEFLRAAGLI